MVGNIARLWSLLGLYGHAGLLWHLLPSVVVLACVWVAPPGSLSLLVLPTVVTCVSNSDELLLCRLVLLLLVLLDRLLVLVTLDSLDGHIDRLGIVEIDCSYRFDTSSSSSR